MWTENLTISLYPDDKTNKYRAYRATNDIVERLISTCYNGFKASRDNIINDLMGGTLRVMSRKDKKHGYKDVSVLIFKRWQVHITWHFNSTKLLAVTTGEEDFDIYKHYGIDRGTLGYVVREIANKFSRMAGNLSSIIS